MILDNNLKKSVKQLNSKNKIMDRKEFISQVGLGAASLLFINCMGGCSKSADGPNMTPTPPPQTNVDFTIDLNASSSSNLNTAGGFIYMNNIIIVKTTSGSFLAVSQACTHEGTTVTYQLNGERFFCPNHGSTFSNSGAVLNGPANRALTQYKTSVSGNNLRIFS